MKTFQDFIKEQTKVGTFTKEYGVQLNSSQKAAVLRALEWDIKTYLLDGYDVILRTAKDTERGIAVLLYTKKDSGMSTLVAHKSIGPQGRLVDMMGK